jgi:hypothetical protein
MRSADIAARCREIALRVDASGEWGELAETLREAAAEVGRLRLQENEIVAISIAMSWLPPQSSSSYVALELMLKRLGGGE